MVISIIAQLLLLHSIVKIGTKVKEKKTRKLIMEKRDFVGECQQSREKNLFPILVQFIFETIIFTRTVQFQPP